MLGGASRFAAGIRQRCSDASFRIELPVPAAVFPVATVVSGVFNLLPQSVNKIVDRIAEEAGEGAKIRMRLGGKSGAVSGDPVDLDPHDQQAPALAVSRSFLPCYSPCSSA